MLRVCLTSSDLKTVVFVQVGAVARFFQFEEGSEEYKEISRDMFSILVEAVPTSGPSMDRLAASPAEIAMWLKCQRQNLGRRHALYGTAAGLNQASA